MNRPRLQRSGRRSDQRGAFCDEDTGAVERLAAQAARRRALGNPPRRRHAVQHAIAGLRQELRFVRGRSGEAGSLTVANTSGRRRWIVRSVTSIIDRRSGEQRFVVTDMDVASGGILAKNAYNSEHPGAVAFFRASDLPVSYTGDRNEFIGRNRSLAAPAALFRERLAGRTGAGLDPCAALQIAIDLKPGASRQIAFALGQGRDHEHARTLADRYGGPTAVKTALTAPERSRDDRLGPQVHTPDPST